MWFMYIKDCGQEVINRLHKATLTKKKKQNIPRKKWRSANCKHAPLELGNAEDAKLTQISKKYYTYIFTAKSNLLLLLLLYLLVLFFFCRTLKNVFVCV